MKKQVLRKEIGLVLIGLMIFVLSGCNSSKEETTVPEEQKAATQANQALLDDTIRSLSTDELAALGPKTSVPNEWVFPNAHYAQIIFPTRFMKYADAPNVIKFLQSNRSQIPFLNIFGEISEMLLSTKIAMVNMKEAKSGQPLGQPIPFPIQAVYLKMTKPIDQENFQSKLFVNIAKDKITKKKIGNYEVLFVTEPITLPMDEKGEQQARLDDFQMTLYYPTPDTVVFVTGPNNEIERFFSDLKGDDRGIIAQRVGRVDPQKNDFIFIYDYSHPLGSMNASFLPPPVGETVTANSDALTLTIDASAKEGTNALTMIVKAKTAESLGKINSDLSSGLMELVQQATKQEKEAPKEAVSQFMKGIPAIVKKIKIEKDETTKILTAVLPFASDVPSFFVDVFKELNQSVENMQKMRRLDIQRTQLYNLSRIFTTYYSKNNAYPPLAITDAKGTPLLSWRVALLPAFGASGEELYKKFKLDEPWNGPNNIKLLANVPNVYQIVSGTTPSTKTTFQILSMPNTPFGKKAKDLSIKDIEHPNRTLLVVSTDPAKAVEWTKPDSLTVAPDKLIEFFGEYILAIPFMGDPVVVPLENKPESITTAMDWITGAKPAEAKPAEAKPAEAKPAEAKPAEAKPAETKPAETKPAETKPAETKPAETKPAETKPAETKPAEAKPAETKPAETKPAEAKPAEAKPAEAKPAEAKPAEAKPAETKPAETKPAEAKPAK